MCPVKQQVPLHGMEKEGWEWPTHSTELTHAGTSARKERQQIESRTSYAGVVLEGDGRLRTRKTPMVSTMMTVTFKPTSMRY